MIVTEFETTLEADNPGSRQPSQQASADGSRSTHDMKHILPIIVIAVGMTVLLVANQQRDELLVVSGTIEADDVRVGSRIGGRVAVVHVGEGQQVVAGQLL